MAAAGVGLELIPVLRSSPEGVEPSLPLLLLVIPPLGARVDVVLEQLPAFSSRSRASCGLDTLSCKAVRGMAVHIRFSNWNLYRKCTKKRLACEGWNPRDQKARS
jgi:hypothetical protein